MASYFMFHLWTVKSQNIKFLWSLNFAVIILEVMFLSRQSVEMTYISYPDRDSRFCFCPSCITAVFCRKKNPLLLTRTYVLLITELLSHFHLLQIFFRAYDPKSRSSGELPLCLLESDITDIKLNSERKVQKQWVSNSIKLNKWNKK